MLFSPLIEMVNIEIGFVFTEVNANVYDSGFYNLKHALLK